MRFFLIDRIVEFEPGKRGTAIKNVSLSEDFFRDHFPTKPVMPGVLILEGMAQLSGTLLSETVAKDAERQVIAIMTIVEKAKFRKPVYPGDTLRYSATIKSYNEMGGKAEVTAHVGKNLVADALLTFVFQELDDPHLARIHADLISMWLKDLHSDEHG